MADKEHIAQVFAEALADAQRLVVDRMHTAIQDAEGTADTSKREALRSLDEALTPARDLAEMFERASVKQIHIPDPDEGATFDDVRSFLESYAGLAAAAVEVQDIETIQNAMAACISAIHEAIHHLNVDTKREAAE